MVLCGAGIILSSKQFDIRLNDNNVTLLMFVITIALLNRILGQRQYENTFVVLIEVYYAV